MQQNLALCEKSQPNPEPAPQPPPEPAAAPPPQIITQTVVRDGGTMDKLAATSFGVGMLGLGVAGGLYLAASSNADAANSARTLDEHDRLGSRASSESTGMVIAGAVGVAAIGYAVFRWTRGGETSKTEVAAVPTTTGRRDWGQVELLSSATRRGRSGRVRRGRHEQGRAALLDLREELARTPRAACRRPRASRRHG